MSDYPFSLRQLLLPKGIREVYSTGTHLNRLTGLTSLNVFIGPNNSGKSRLLRALFNNDTIEYSPPSEINDQLSALCEPVAASARRNQRNKIADLLDRVIPQFPRYVKRQNELHLADDHSLDQLQFDAGLTMELSGGPVDTAEFSRRILNLFRQSWKSTAPERSFKRIYIPTLRGLRTPANHKSFFFDRTLGDYFSNDQRFRDDPASQVSIFTGANLYDHIRDHLLGTLAQRSFVRHFESFLGERFFEGVPVSIIPRANNDVLYIKIGDETEQPIYHLGDGLQQLIIMTLPLFLQRDEDLLLFIEEPELYLHPGYQRVLIDTFLNGSGGVGTRQVFVTTHSNHFLDITIDRTQCSIYRIEKTLDEPGEGSEFEREARYTVSNASNDHFVLLRELGVRNSSVLLSNCTIWVEGITDRLYLRRFFEIYQSKVKNSAAPFMEDLHFSFVEYGGGNITHWSFLDEEEGIDVSRVCGQLFLISDKDGSKKECRIKALRERLGDRYYCLDCREVENLLPPTVIAHVIREYEGNDDIELNEVKWSEYKNRYLGDFIEKKVLPEGYVSKRLVRTGRPYAAKSGTIKDKVGFCKRALKWINDKDDLTDEVRSLCDKIYEFVQSHHT